MEVFLDFDCVPEKKSTLTNVSVETNKWNHTKIYNDGLRTQK